MQLKEYHSLLVFEIADVITEFTGQLLHLIQPAQVADALGNFWKKPETLRCSVAPRNNLVPARQVVKSSIQFDGVELGRIISQFVFGPTQVKVLQVGFVPFGTTYVNVKGFAFIIFKQNFSGPRINIKKTPKSFDLGALLF